MFESTVRRLEDAQREFNDKVRDSLGKSIDNDVFCAVKSDIRSLESAYGEAQNKIAEIRALTAELRALTW